MATENVYYGDLDVTDHGGGCCGVTHLFEFGDEDDFDRKPTLADKVKAIDDVFSYVSIPVTIEVVLTRQQAKVWEKALYASRFKFRRVMEFSNPNTSNILRMYLSTNNIVKPQRKGK